MIRDDNATPVIQAISSIDGVTIVPVRADPITGILLADVIIQPHTNHNSKLLRDDNGQRPCAMVEQGTGKIVPVLIDDFGAIMVDITYV